MGTIITVFPTEMLWYAEDNDINLFSDSTVVYKQDRGFCIVTDLDKDEPRNVIMGVSEFDIRGVPCGSILYLNRQADDNFGLPHHYVYMAFAQSKPKGSGLKEGVGLRACTGWQTKSDITAYLKLRYKTKTNKPDWSFDFNPYKALACFTEVAINPAHKYQNFVEVADYMEQEGIYPFGKTNIHAVYWIN